MESTIAAIQSIIAEADHMKKSYFWAPPSSAGARRSYERQHSHELVEWDDNGRHYTAEYTVSCSARNIYASGSYTRDGQKTTLTAIKNSLRRLQAST